MKAFLTISFATSSVASASWGRWHLAQIMRFLTVTSSGFLTPEFFQPVSPTATVVLMVAAVLPVPKMEREWIDFASPCRCPRGTACMLIHRTSPQARRWSSPFLLQPHPLLHRTCKAGAEEQARRTVLSSHTSYE